MPPIIIFKLYYAKNYLSEEQFLRLKQLSKVEQFEIIEREGIEVNSSDWFDLEVADTLDERTFCHQMIGLSSEVSTEFKLRVREIVKKKNELNKFMNEMEGKLN